VPAELSLPDGAKPAAITFGSGWTAVVTTDERILIFDSNGLLLQEVTIPPTPGP
jgi:sugar lactone lactonase YvrE